MAAGFDVSAGRKTLARLPTILESLYGFYNTKDQKRAAFPKVDVCSKTFYTQRHFISFYRKASNIVVEVNE